MHQKTTTYFSFCLSMILMAFSFGASANGDPNESTAYFSLDECHSNSSDNSFMDYSEFTADINESPDGPAISIVGGNLYRANASVNHHSCTPGVGGDPGMCFSAVDDCDFNPSSTRSVRIDVLVTPGANGVGVLSNLSFYEQGIPEFTWIGGDSGDNDYPTLFAVQVLKDGDVVYSQEGIATTTEWSEVNIDFGGDEDLVVNEATEFQIRLTGYCLVGNGAPIAVWDIDEVTVTASDAGVSGGTIAGGPFEFCVGDGEADNIAADAITLSGNSGANSQWVVTDDQGNILGLPPTFSVVDFDGAGAGTCLVWHLSYDGALTGAEVGLNAADLGGCYSLSNSIPVVRNQPDGGTLEGGPFEFCVGDGIEDNIAEDAITLTGASGANGQWVVTDSDNNILGLPPTFSVVNFDGAGAGTCLVWYLRYDGAITGLEAGMNTADLAGCYSLSNSISVVRNQPSGGTLEGGPFEFCVGDGVEDNIAEDAITLTGASGANGQWVITDSDNNILGLPPTFSAVNFDGAGAGTCLVWYLRYDGAITGLEAGMNTADLAGCFSLSNSISVVRNQPSGGTLEGGPFEFCVGDGVEDNIAEDAITLTGASGANSQWVVTDDQGNILGLPPTFSVVDFDGAGVGTCLVWHLSYDGALTGAEVGMNAADLGGCFNLSNSIAVNRIDCSTGVLGGTLEGGPFTFCVDGEADNVSGITLNGNTGMNNQWIVTDVSGNILGLPPMPGVVDFDAAGPGVCLIWNVSYDGTIEGLEMGANTADLMGDYGISNSVSVTRNEAAGGTLEGGPFEFCVGDGVMDTIAAGSITLSGNTGAETQWIVTDDQGNILGLPPMPSVVNFDGAGEGTCLVWHLSYYGDIEGLEMGSNANDLAGCFALSNSISVVRTDCSTSSVSGGTLEGGPFEFCVDGEVDNVSGITLDGNTGMNNQWIVTDEAGNILGLPPMPGVVDFDEAGPGVCLIWNVSYDGTIEGLEMGANTADLMGDFGISNSITVTRNEAIGGTLEGGPFEFCVGDGEADNIPATDITLSGETGEISQWVVTDDQGNILGLPPTFSVVDFDGAGFGTCQVWHLSYYGSITGLEVDANTADLDGCYSFSNAISVSRIDCGTPEAIIVINEVNGSDEVEITNIGDASQDISSYWLCNFPAYTQISNADLVCGGDLVLEPGEFVTVNAGFAIDAADGEMGLYTTNSFGSSDAIISYVEWGSTGHTRSSVAVNAGVWTSGDFVAAFTDPNSIEYDGEGNMASDWTEDIGSPCEENFTTNIGEVSYTLYPNPAVNNITIQFEELMDGVSDIEIFDAIGNRVETAQHDIKDGSSKTMSIAHYRGGAYFVRVSNGKSFEVQRFIRVAQ